MHPHRIFAVSASALLLAACATAPGSAGPSAPAAMPARHRLSAAADLDAAAALLRLEDRREYDAAALASSAAATNAEVRQRAALAIGRIKDRRGVPQLVQMLGDADTAVAASAAFSLGQMGDSAAVPALAALLDAGQIGGRPTVVGEAAAALGKLKTAGSRAALEGFLRAVPVAGPNRVEAVGPALLAVWKYPRPADVSPILPWLASTDPEIRWRAAYALSRRPDPRSAEALYRVAGDEDARVRSFAVRALAATLADSSSVGAPAALAALLRATADADQAVRVNATRSLGTHAGAESVAVLRRLLGGADVHQALVAAEALARLGAKAAAAAADLRTAAEDAPRPVGIRTAALAALVTAGPADAASVAAQWSSDPSWRLRAAAGQAFAALGAAHRDQALSLARDRDGRVASTVLGAVVEAAGKDLAPLQPLLVESLGNPDAQVRTTALGALGTLADPSTLPAVLDAYGRTRADTVDDAALAAIDALGAMRKATTDASARSFFARYPRPEDYLARQHAAAAFGDTLSAPWGPPLPIEPNRPAGDYQRIVQQDVASVLAGRPRRHTRIVTSRGEIEVELLSDVAPLTVENFLSLARRGFFDGQEWPRVVPNFVIQGGDPRGDTSGGPGYGIRDELNREPYARGTMGMALSGPDTGGSQWFITHSAQPHLDAGYTVFGRVVRGMDVVDRIVQGDRIIRVEEVR